MGSTEELARELRLDLLSEFDEEGSLIFVHRELHGYRHDFAQKAKCGCCPVVVSERDLWREDVLDIFDSATRVN